MKSIASYNGLQAAREAFDLMRRGVDPTEAVVAGVTLVEDDPEEMTVGYGGIPNEDGIVELDAAVMDGTSHRVGAVAALRNVRHAARVALLVMRQTNRVLLAGEGAYRFAIANGFPHEDLVTEKSRRLWMHWKRIRSRIDDWQVPASDEIDAGTAEYFARFLPQAGSTVHCAGLDDTGRISCTTSTSGHPFKIPGRVGDSPIAGAGLFACHRAGTCGSIGHGEANLENLSCFLGVELMRQGLTPLEAGLEVLRRVEQNTPQMEYDSAGLPRMHLQLFLLSRDGDHAGVTFSGRRTYAVTDEQGSRQEECVALYPAS